jgi:hypothetical protein
MLDSAVMMDAQATEFQLTKKSMVTESQAGTCGKMNNVASPTDEQAEAESEERKVKGKGREAEEADVDHGDGEDGSGTDDEYMVFDHEDVAWTGIEPVHLYNTKRKRKWPAQLAQSEVPNIICRRVIPEERRVYDFRTFKLYDIYSDL